MIGLLVLLNAYFVVAEFALVKVRGSRLEALVQEGHKRAKQATHLNLRADAYILACQICTAVSTLSLGLLGGTYASNWFMQLMNSLETSEMFAAWAGYIIGFAIISILYVVLGQFVPRLIAARYAEQLALNVMAPIGVISMVLSPFTWLLNKLANRLFASFGMNSTDFAANGAHTEEEIRNLVKESHKSGFIDNTELTLVDNIFDFADTNAREIMIPRTEMVCLFGNLTYEENRTIAFREMHTRYPVCEKDKDNIIGFVHIKDLLKTTDQSILDIRDLIRPMTTVPESMPISELLKLMQKRKSQIAVLIDEYGGTSGLVTMEDIMEEIVGEIQDEFDEERPDVEVRDENTYSISGMMLIDEVNHLFGTEIPMDDYDTIGGWIYSQIEIPPTRDQQVVTDDGLQFTIDEVDNMRISRVTVTRMGSTAWLPHAETG